MRLCSQAGTTIAIRQLLPEIQILGEEEVFIEACQSQPSRVKPGDLFAVLSPPGLRREAAVEQALQHGAAAILTEEILPGLPVPVICVPNVREAYGRVCHALHGFPARNLNLITIAGAYGKTTVACLIARILVQAGLPVGMLTSLGYFDGEDSVFPAETTPPPEELAQRLANMVERGCTHAIVEVSGKALRQHYTAGLECDTIVLLNDDPFARNRQIIASHFARQLKREGLMIVNAEDSRCRAVLAETDRPALSVAVQGCAEITASEIERHLGEETFFLNVGYDTFPIRTRMFGRHHVLNCLAAIAVGLTYEIPLDVIVQAIESVDSIPGRLQRVVAGQPFSVFVDAADRPAALQAVLQAVRPHVAKRLICVATPPKNPRRDAARWWQLVTQASDMVIMTLADPGRDDPTELEAFLSQTGAKTSALVRIDRTEALGWALMQAQPEDCVLVVGNGHRRWRPVKDHDLEVDDYQFIQQWLRQEYTASPSIEV